jgi:membrane protein
MRIHDFGRLLADAVKQWLGDNAPRLGAALAYYTVFSIAPLLVIAVAIAGFVFGEEAAKGQVYTTMQGLVGETGALAIQGMMEQASKARATGITATILGFVTLLLGASGVFGQLKGALNTIWNVEGRAGGTVKSFLVDRLFSLAMVLSVGFLLLVSLVISTMLAALAAYAERLVPLTAEFWQLVNAVVSFGVVTLLFALLFKEVPDTDVQWRDVWIGALFTAVLFTIGKFLIGLYLGRGTVGSVYGAAGSLVIVLLWVYYSAQILFFGAEFTQVFARRYGSQARTAA